MAKVIHIDSSSSGGTGTGFLTVQDNYTALITAFPTAPLMSLAYVQNSQGTAWLPGGFGGTFYSKGTYLFDGANWVSSVDEIANELQEILDNMNTQDFESVLSNGIMTGAYDIILEQLLKSGKASLNLNSGVDGDAEIKNDKLSVKFLNDGTFNTTSGNFPIDTHFTQIIQNLNSIVFALVKNDFTKFGQISLAENDTIDVSSGFLPNYPAIIAAQSSVIKNGVVNSAISGGKGIIGKTNDTNYSTQIGYSKSSEPFELIIKHNTPTADRTQIHQDDDGDIALTKNLAISKGYLIQNIITVPTLTATVNDWSPIGFDDTTDLIRVDVNANNRSISGIVAPPLGVNRVLGIKNLNTVGNDLRFEHNNAGSLAVNRFLCRDNTRKSIKPNEIALWFYDHIVQRWTPFNRIG